MMYRIAYCLNGQTHTTVLEAMNKRDAKRQFLDLYPGATIINIVFIP